MEKLEESGDFRPPTGRSLERVLEAGLSLTRGRVFVDLWDAERFFPCPVCRGSRVARLQEMNLRQIATHALIDCPECQP